MQRADGLLRLYFGLVTDEAVAHHHPGDEHGIRQASRKQGESRRRPQKIDGEGIELLQEDAQAGARFGLREHIGAVTLQVSLGRLAG